MKEREKLIKAIIEHLKKASFRELELVFYILIGGAA